MSVITHSAPRFPPTGSSSPPHGENSADECRPATVRARGLLEGGPIPASREPGRAPSTAGKNQGWRTRGGHVTPSRGPEVSEGTGETLLGTELPRLEGVLGTPMGSHNECRARGVRMLERSARTVGCSETVWTRQGARGKGTGRALWSLQRAGGRPPNGRPCRPEPVPPPAPTFFILTAWPGHCASRGPQGSGGGQIPGT